MDAGRRRRCWTGLAAALVCAIAVAHPAPAADDAVTERQDIGHTGFAGGGSLDKPPLSQRWSREIGALTAPALAAGGRAFAVTTESSKSSPTLYALDIASGGTSWFRPVATGTRLAYDGGRLFLVDANGIVTALDATTGSTLWMVDLPGRGVAPTAADGVLYVGLQEGLYALDELDGSVEWQNTAVDVHSSVTLDARNVYFNDDCDTEARTRDEGNRSWFAAGTGCTFSSGRRMVATGAFVFSPSRLLDAGTGTVREQLFGGNPAVAGGVELTLNGRVLQARNVRTGAGLWEFTGDGKLNGFPTIVNHTVYIGSESGALFAVDLTSGAQTWTAPVGSPVVGCSYGCPESATGWAGMTAAQGVLLVPARGRLIALDDQTAVPRAGLDLEILTGPAGPQPQTSAAFTFGATGSGFSTRCRMDRQSWTACGGAASFDALRDGPHVFEVETVDGEGKPIALATRGFSVVTGRPTTTITAGPPALSRNTEMCSGYCYSNEDPAIAFKTMNAVRSECRIDGGAWAECTSPYSTSATLSQGSHVVEVRSYNSVDVVETPAERHEWVVDSVAPKVTFTKTPATPTKAMTGTAEFTANEDGVTFFCGQDSSSTMQPCTSPFTQTVTASGSHYISVAARDRAGNLGTTVSTTWWVEPDTEITEGPPASTMSRSATFRYRNPIGSYYDFACRIDGGPWSSCSTTRTYNDLAPGEHLFEVKTRYSSAGTVEDQTPATWRWTVATDEAPPETTITSATSPGPGTARLHFTSSESGSTFACQADGGAWVVCSSPVTYTSLSGGSHQFAVRATDPSANTDPTPATATVVVEDPPQEEEPAQQEPVTAAPTGRSAAPRPPAPSATPAVTAAPAPVTAAQLRRALPSTPRALATALASSIASVDSASFAKDEELLVGFAPSRAGRLTVQLVATSRGKRVVVARGSKAFKAGSSGFVAVKATAAGRKLLARSAKLRLSVEASFKPARGATARGKAKATMARAKKG